MGREVQYQETMRDVLRLLVERASQKADATSTFEQGVRMGYFEAVSAILGELETFGIDLGEVGMAGFDPASMLQPARRAA
ncbi:MAG: hypothetical protein AMXMBFR78_18140 [Rubrivivax sp.]|jgi:hypothetical protein